MHWLLCIWKATNILVYIPDYHNEVTIHSVHVKMFVQKKQTNMKRSCNRSKSLDKEPETS